MYVYLIYYKADSRKDSIYQITSVDVVKTEQAAKNKLNKFWDDWRKLWAKDSDLGNLTFEKSIVDSDDKVIIWDVFAPNPILKFEIVRRELKD